MQNQVVEEIAKHLGVTIQDIDINSSLAEDLGLGPVELADLIAALSLKFQVNFDPAETENLKTVHDLVVVIEDLSLE